MKLFKRIHVQFRSSIEELLNSVENHEAVSEAAIKELQQHFAKARLKLERVKANEKALHKKMETAEHEAKTWQDRAKKLAEKDREKALMCLQRSKTAQERNASLEEQSKALSSSIVEMEKTVNNMKDRIEKAKLKREQLAVRDYQSKISDVKNCSADGEGDLTAVLDRWEEKVVGREIQQECEVETSDSLEREFEEQEKKSELKDELTALIADDGKDKS